MKLPVEAYFQELAAPIYGDCKIFTLAGNGVFEDDFIASMPLEEYLSKRPAIYLDVLTDSPADARQQNAEAFVQMLQENGFHPNFRIVHTNSELLAEVSSENVYNFFVDTSTFYYKRNVTATTEKGDWQEGSL